MKTIRYSTKYKKDIKRYARNEKFLEALLDIVKHLEQGKPIPAEHRPHPLKGEYKECMECHVLSDFLLIWYDEAADTIWLERVGTHSELFK